MKRLFGTRDVVLLVECMSNTYEVPGFGAPALKLGVAMHSCNLLKG